MKTDTYVTMMKNDLDEMLCVTFLDTNPTDAEDRAKRYAKQLNGCIMKHECMSDNGSKTYTMAYRRPRKKS